MMTEPKGYWSRVFQQATALMNTRRDLNGDAAYWMARRLVDETLDQTILQPPRRGPVEGATLVLAP